MFHRLLNRILDSCLASELNPGLHFESVQLVLLRFNDDNESYYISVIVDH